MTKQSSFRTDDIFDVLAFRFVIIVAVSARITIRKLYLTKLCTEICVRAQARLVVSETVPYGTS